MKNRCFVGSVAMNLEKVYGNKPFWKGIVHKKISVFESTGEGRTPLGLGCSISAAQRLRISNTQQGLISRKSPCSLSNRNLPHSQLHSCFRAHGRARYREALRFLLLSLRLGAINLILGRMDLAQGTGTSLLFPLSLIETSSLVSA